jgi:hypothetical protein
VTQIGRTLVFEGLDQAANYRQYVCKTLRGSPADIVTLCGNKLSGRGVVLGSGFKVVPVEQAPCRFGTIPRGQQVSLRGHAWRRLVLVLLCIGGSQVALATDGTCKSVGCVLVLHDLQGGTPAAVRQCEAAAEGLIEALQQQEEVVQELQEAQAAAEQPEQQQLDQQRVELVQQLRQLESHIKQRQQGMERPGPAREAAAARDDEEVVVVEGEGGGGGAVAAAEGRQQRSKRRRV